MFVKFEANANFDNLVRMLQVSDILLVRISSISEILWYPQIAEILNKLLNYRMMVVNKGSTEQNSPRRWAHIIHGPHERATETID